MKRHTVIDSPYGPLTLVADDGVLCGLYMTDQRHRPAQETFGDRADPGSAAPAARAFAEAGEQLEAYFAGGLKEFTLELRPHGTPFQRRVWDLLRGIPYGETRTYGELAAALGSPKASRAVGLANGRNPIGIVIPCHRVVGASGGLTGYGGGLERKRRLLDHERDLPALFPQVPPSGSVRGPRTGAAGAASLRRRYPPPPPHLYEGP
ncbi:methylated-DNA--[protein]-cysteine S-methyltransferase [Streptomyces prasinopilosus]|uniref:methylated-DNA--[protein]-cysteine S-methyltransferase n=1 Tax=Streptomyces prasinopilosus TaxID=67344 RepID=UPI00099EBD79|nr:methylated-DNA--[protein]-cysteine S-methyltransferase [Streptomyces prasinopilosus]